MFRTIIVTKFVLVLLTLLFSMDVWSQARWIPYLNAGYITSIKTPPDCYKPDAGGTIRIGILNKGLFEKGRLGFYGGYSWFKEYQEDYVGYDDRGSILLAGIDYLVLRRSNFRVYGKLGLGGENFISTYPGGREEKEFSMKPDFGVLFNIKYVNAYLGWQPSDPFHYNIGLGVSLGKYSRASEVGY